MQLTNEQIETIISGCKLNERRAQKEFYAHYYGFAMSISLRYAVGYNNAVEMVNDGFLKIFKEFKKFEPRYDSTIASLLAWMKRIIINSCIDYLRKYEKANMIIETDTDELVLADNSENGAEMMQYKEVVKCIQQLSPAYKAVFNLFVIDGFTHEEIAQRLNISVNTSKSNLFKAKHNLQLLVKKSNAINYV